jgi:hypothetical protein
MKDSEPKHSGPSQLFWGSRKVWRYDAAPPLVERHSNGYTVRWFLEVVAAIRSVQKGPNGQRLRTVDKQWSVRGTRMDTIAKWAL